jgi:hypothetical protein
MVQAAAAGGVLLYGHSKMDDSLLNYANLNLFILCDR